MCGKLQINFNTYSFSCLLLDLNNHKQLIMSIMIVMKLVKSRNPTPIGHDDNTCEFSPQLQSFG